MDYVLRAFGFVTLRNQGMAFFQIAEDGRAKLGERGGRKHAEGEGLIAFVSADDFFRVLRGSDDGCREKRAKENDLVRACHGSIPERLACFQREGDALLRFALAAE